jgi:hypothetical protein
MIMNDSDHAHRERNRGMLPLVTIGLTLLVHACAGNQSIRGSMTDVDLGRWEVLGQTEVRFPPLLDSPTRIERVIAVGITTAFSRFRVVNHEWANNIAEIEVVLDNGSVWQPPVAGGYLKNSASEIVDIPEGPRLIKLIRVAFQASVTSAVTKSSFVYFWGERAQ